MSIEEFTKALGADKSIPLHAFTPSKVDWDRCKVCYEHGGHPVHNPLAHLIAWVRPAPVRTDEGQTLLRVPLRDVHEEEL